MVMNGDPSVTLGRRINFTQSVPTFPITLTEKGGISYGPHPAGSCKLNVTYTINSETSCTISRDGVWASRQRKLLIQVAKKEPPQQFSLFEESLGSYARFCVSFCQLMTSAFLWDGTGWLAS